MKYVTELCLFVIDGAPICEWTTLLMFCEIHVFIMGRGGGGGGGGG